MQNAKPNGVFIPADKMGVVLQALHFYRLAAGLGRRVENTTRYTNLYAEVCKVVGYIASRDFELPKKDEESSKRLYARTA